MDLQAEKIALVKKILDVEDPDILNEVKHVLEQEEGDFWHYLPQHVKDGIEEGLRDVANGRYFSHEEVMKEFKSKYGSQH
ncbi:hypothetical protein MUY27_00480 [Mucilaginibacter sp. RS28]|uniref:Addiction module component n=1 Tax=Mucilaginibacter straminoryzae TaxID=2932774 RepID=A0A9X1X0K7_9SPHI|nr:hypothetical protein [Mucilaginibacter straminoryzae]MCJ8208160.1 hypothetical protein [Mucilaginibacter straminoryzae]